MNNIGEILDSAYKGVLDKELEESRKVREESEKAPFKEEWLYSEIENSEAVKQFESRLHKRFNDLDLIVQQQHRLNEINLRSILVEQITISNVLKLLRTGEY